MLLLTNENEEEAILEGAGMKRQWKIEIWSHAYSSIYHVLYFEAKNLETK